eukprot:CFRG2938T1
MFTKKSVPVLEDFNISKTTGFLPEKDPLLSLPAKYASWDKAAAEMPSYLLAGCMRQQLDMIPSLSIVDLTTEAEYQRAYSILSMLSHAYVWCEGENSPSKRLPANLAVPWVAVANWLGCKPILTHSAVVMYNWKLINADGPADLSNLACLTTFNGCKDEAWFYLVTVAIEALGGPAVEAITDAMDAVNNVDAETVATKLNILADAVDEMTVVILRMFEKCDPKVYYKDVRPFFSGWRGNPVLPDGLLYEGVSDVPFEFAGGSAGQSSLLQTIDIALGVRHGPTQQCPMMAAMDSPPVSENEMSEISEEILDGLAQTPSVDTECSYISTVRAYMPRKHRHFLTALGNAPSLHGFVMSPHGTEAAKAAFNNAVKALANFRTKHIQLVASYIVAPASKKESTLASYRGTGGSSIMPFLKQVRTETLDQLTPNT